METKKAMAPKSQERLAVQHQAMIELNRREASMIKSLSIDLNKEVSSTGGVKELILQLNQAVGAEPHNSAALEQLRDTLIQKHYGPKAWQFLESILPAPARSRSKAGEGTYINSSEE